MTCFLEEKHTPLTFPRGSNSKKKDTEKTSYGTLFSLKDEAALFPFVREVMQNCTTEYHLRPKCGRNIHRYINIKVSPIQTFLPNLIPLFFFHFPTHMTACVPCCL